MQFDYRDFRDRRNFKTKILHRRNGLKMTFKSLLYMFMIN